MSLRQKVVKGVFTVTGGNVVAQGLAFTRIAILANLLSKEDFGIAATFLVTIAFLTMLGDLGIDRLLVQARDGEEKPFQGAAHLLLAIRGLIVGAIIFFSAGLIGLLFDVPDAIWAFRCLAIVPIVKGFTHTDCRRLERQLRFKATVFVEVFPQLIIAIAAWPIATWLGDYSAVLWLVIAQAVSTVIGSHIVAKRPYRITFNINYLMRFLSFGWPLLVNGLLIFGIFHGDRVIVGTWYTMGELGVYSVAFALLQAPKMLITRSASALMLPLFSRVQDDHEAFCQRYRQSGIALALISSCIAVVLIISAFPLIILIYGEKYSAVNSFLVWLVIMQAVRLLRVVPILAAMALGDTKNLMYSNMWRNSTLSIAVIAAVMDYELMWIAAAGCLGEIIALLYSMIRLARRQRIAFGLIAWPFILSGLWIALTAAITSLLEIGTNWGVVIGISTAMLICVLLSMLSISDLRTELSRAISIVRKKSIAIQSDAVAINDIAQRK
ncbi:MAG: oligosaccharide flippase family protein [Planctomycetes bacterium]|nr:oligosaccharide flippase family protein [Planctomycetota bacterium]